MIYEVEGDILLSEAEAIAHGIAPDDHFNQGLALSLKDRWPAMYKDFRHYCHVSHPKTGEAWIWGGPGVRVINLFTQEPPKCANSHPGKANLANIKNCMKSLKKTLEKEGFKSLAITKIATGVGGLEWNDVYPILKEQLSDLNIPVYVYKTFKADQKAVEKE